MALVEVDLAAVLLVLAMSVLEVEAGMETEPLGSLPKVA